MLGATSEAGSRCPQRRTGCPIGTVTIAAGTAAPTFFAWVQGKFVFAGAEPWTLTSESVSFWSSLS
jgi:hypothetical protein